jgi:methylmalonyl-CoA mutase N-terminal domain/subunit
LGGSYFIESLTDEVETAAWELIEQVDAMGGSIAAIEQGFMQNEIARSAYEHQRQVEANERIIVGVNKFQNNQENKIPLFKIDDSIRKLQAEKLKQLKESRDNIAVKNCLQTLNDKAVSGENIMPAVIDAVENFCTLGEIADELREVFGEFH